MQAQEEAIERGLKRVEAGAQGEHKIQRGYLPRLHDFLTRCYKWKTTAFTSGPLLLVDCTVITMRHCSDSCVACAA